MGLRETSSKNVQIGSKWKYLSDNIVGNNPTFVVGRITTRAIHFGYQGGYSHDRSPSAFLRELVPVRGVEPEMFAQIKALVCQLAFKPADRIKLQEELVRSNI